MSKVYTPVEQGVLSGTERLATELRRTVFSENDQYPFKKLLPRPRLVLCQLACWLPCHINDLHEKITKSIYLNQIWVFPPHDDTTVIKLRVVWKVVSRTFQPAVSTSLSFKTTTSTIIDFIQLDEKSFSTFKMQGRKKNVNRKSIVPSPECMQWINFPACQERCPGRKVDLQWIGFSLWIQKKSHKSTEVDSAKESFSLHLMNLLESCIPFGFFLCSTFRDEW